MRGFEMKAILFFLSSTACGILIFVVRVYKVTLSPLIGPCCRFEPTCSTYCIEALRVHGLFKGLWLTLRRLCRCRPFGPSGYDPVPPVANRATTEVMDKKVL